MICHYLSLVIMTETYGIMTEKLESKSIQNCFSANTARNSTALRSHQKMLAPTQPRPSWQKHPLFFLLLTNPLTCLSLFFTADPSNHKTNSMRLVWVLGARRQGFQDGWRNAPSRRARSPRSHAVTVLSPTPRRCGARWRSAPGPPRN